tara:strand:- start:357 stop:632 length:276 start_codon:yes stop_codon:yes gene_type:complete
MIHKILVSNILIILILEISIPKNIQAGHKRNLINKFCIATLKSKLNLKDKKKLDDISHFTCECFFRKFKSGSSIKSSRIFCRNKAKKKYNL